MSLTVSKLHVNVEGSEILHGITLDVESGTVHAVMGPNGSGKSTLAYALAGHPRYDITQGAVQVDKTDLTHLAPHERAQAGLFLSFQYPVEVAGVPVRQFLRSAQNAFNGKQADPIVFSNELKSEMQTLHFDPSFASRSLNEGFSGGEKKRLEMLQLAVLKPKYAVLDETDSGLDVDAIKLVGNTVREAKERGAGILFITHYSRILRFVAPDVVHVVVNGRVVQSGDAALAERIEKRGYESFRD